MYDYQEIVLQWAMTQGAAASLLVLALGLCYGLHGYRFLRPLLAMSAGMLGLVFGAALAEALGLVGGLAPLAAVAAGVLALSNRKLGLTLCAIGVFASLGYYIFYQLDMPPQFTLGACAIGAGLGLMQVRIAPRTTPLVLTSLIGAVTIVAGFVGAAAGMYPALAETFVAWSSRWSLLLPVMLFMLFITGMAFQANAMQGDMQSGWSEAASDERPIQRSAG